MSHQNVFLVILYGITIFQRHVTSSVSEYKYSHPLSDDQHASLQDDNVVRLALLSDTGGLQQVSRVRREAADPNADQPRGYTQMFSSFNISDVNSIDVNEDTLRKDYERNNKTMRNSTSSTKYYKPKFVEDGTDYFFDLDHANDSKPHLGKVKEHSMLSQSYRRAATVTLNFRFPFYGHEVENITIATGGFLYTGEYVHSWLAATQYIAPLMANFDTSANKDAKIRYLDTGESFIVEWNNVYLQEKQDQGPFTFQVHLNKSGDIHFAYQRIPLEIETIKDEEHPVKVGLSDACIIDRTIFFVRRKTIYEYHRVNMKHHKIAPNSAIVFKALFTCNQQTDCSSCLSLLQTR